eukprot:TRINITY_DN5741_c0_g1_i1.p1 TRINITY_DN5741_c0_g1~~TRINITY_DN5741_c0_g1_i1.p1  ORF type:complete len:513 (-),score=-19.33 TRINITY_DN5741_c0_g1_i1:255-1769(-)
MATALAWLLCFLLSLGVLFAKRWNANYNRKKKNLPPGPPGLPVIGNLLELRRKPFINLVKELRKDYGGIFMLRMGTRPIVIVTSAELAHEALVEKGHLFANRPSETPTRRIFSSDKCTINSAEYGPRWRDLRRNLISQMLNPTAVKHFSKVRHRAIQRLVEKLRREAEHNGGVVHVPPNCRFAVFCILMVMCFGEEFDQGLIEQMDATHKEVLLALEPRLDDFLPGFLAPLFADQRRRVAETRRRQVARVLPLIERRRRHVEAHGNSSEAYLDTLFEVRLEDEKRRKLSDDELVSLCSEFLNGGTDTTATGLEWAVAHVMADIPLQEAVVAEMDSVTGGRPICEDDLENLPLLTAVIKESLRLHPPTHFLLSHAVTDDGAILGGYDIPYGANVEFYTAGMGYDERLWKDAAEFRPQRFLAEDRDVDLKGAKGTLKMMPFGAGRRVCAGLNVGFLHLTLILGRILQAFRWAPPGDPASVDFTEQFAFTVVLKQPLRALISPRQAS